MLVDATHEEIEAAGNDLANSGRIVIFDFYFHIGFHREEKSDVET